MLSVARGSVMQFTLALFSLLLIASSSSGARRYRRDGVGAGAFSGASSSAGTFSSGGGEASLSAFAGMAWGFPPAAPDFSSIIRSYQAALEELQASAAEAAQAAQAGHAYHMKQFDLGPHNNYFWPGFPPPFFTNWGGGGNDVGASASGFIGPDGGSGTAEVHPSPDLGLRFGGAPQAGGQFPAPQGGSYGVFSSSSSGQTSINGKTTGFKTATVGVNDNGKVTTYTAHDP